MPEPWVWWADAHPSSSSSNQCHGFLLVLSPDCVKNDGSKVHEYPDVLGRGKGVYYGAEAVAIACWCWEAICA